VGEKHGLGAGEIKEEDGNAEKKSRVA
jgi:hypothetical protein